MRGIRYQVAFQVIAHDLRCASACQGSERQHAGLSESPVYDNADPRKLGDTPECKNPLHREEVTAKIAVKD